MGSRLSANRVWMTGCSTYRFCSKFTLEHLCKCSCVKYHGDTDILQRFQNFRNLLRNPSSKKHLNYSFRTMSRYAHCEVCSSQSQKNIHLQQMWTALYQMRTAFGRPPLYHPILVLCMPASSLHWEGEVRLLTACWELDVTCSFSCGAKVHTLGSVSCV